MHILWLHLPYGTDMDRQVLISHEIHLGSILMYAGVGIGMQGVGSIQDEQNGALTLCRRYFPLMQQGPVVVTLASNSRKV